MSVKLKDELLSLAAAETRERIRLDRRRVSKKLQPILQYIEDHLFDPDLNIDSLKRACGVANNVRLGLFAAEVKETPHFYIKRCRSEAAKKLLRDTKLKVHEIAKMVGYPHARAFSTAFHRTYLELPTEYRARMRRQADWQPRSRDLRSIEVWEQAHDGKLEVHEAVALVEHFQKLYNLEPDVKLLRWPTDGEAFEQFQAQRAWQTIENESVAVQTSAVRFQAEFSTSAFFELLRQKSREAGRKDRQRGIELAELAIASLEGSARKLGDRLPDLKARGRAWLGNVRRQALDFPGAEEALNLAESAWTGSRLPKDPVAEGEVFLYRASLRLYQRRFEEARQLATPAIDLFQEAKATALQAQALIVRANISGYSGKARAAIPDLAEAIRLLDGCDEPFVLTSAYVNIATIYALEGSLDQAARALVDVKKAAPVIDSRLVQHQLQWIEALVATWQGNAREAESLLRRALAGFIAMKEADYAAVVSLDLAIVLKKQMRDDEVLQLVSQALPFFEALKIHQEAIVALDVLTEAIKSQSIILSELHRSRSRLVQLQLSRPSQVTP